MDRSQFGDTLEVRFWPKVAKGADGECWHWNASLNGHGYGQLSQYYRGGYCRPFLAHRVSYMLAHGPFADELVVLHSCDNPRCVNPAHLFLGTQADNMADAKAKGRNKNATRRGITSHLAKITEEDVIAIRRRVKAGEARREIASEFGLTSSAIDAIHRRRCWAHVPD